MKKITIIGAGLAGLMAAYQLSKKYDVLVLEKKSELKNNHSAILRFKDDLVRTMTGLPLEEVKVFKNIFCNGNLYNESNIRFNNMYSLKAAKVLRSRSINNLKTETRYIPSPNFYDQLLQLCSQNNVKFATNVNIEKWLGNNHETAIFTIPLPSILKLLEVSHNETFTSNSIDTWTCTLNSIFNSNVHQTIYFPARNYMNPAYRISIIKDRVVAELNSDIAAHQQSDFLSRIKIQIQVGFGVDLYTEKGAFEKQSLGKLVNIDEEKRKELVYNLTKKHGIYLLGRFATWREGIMMPDICRDIMKIEQWIRMEDMLGYDKQKNLGVNCEQ